VHNEEAAYTYLSFCNWIVLLVKHVYWYRIQQMRSRENIFLQCKYDNTLTEKESRG
jgi:hypothetical protein